MIPQGESLAGGFERLTARFLEFTQSADGQNKIKDWMDTAWEAANSLWGILGNVASAIGKVFTSGTEGAGQDFLTYLETITERFDTFLSSPEGKTAMRDFWVDVREVMVTVKDIFEDVGKAIDDLDTAKARGDFQNVVDAVNLLTDALGLLVDGIEIVQKALGWSPTAFLAKMANFGMATDNTTGKTNGFKDALNNANTSGVKLGNTASATKGMLDKFKTGADGATGAVKDTSSANSILQGALRGSQTALSNTSGALTTTKNKANDVSTAVKNIPSTKGVTVSITTTGVSAMEAAGKYFQNLKSKKITLTVGTVMVGGKGFNAGMFMAAGGVRYGPTHAIIGEAGPEAVVPLDRPLSQVDPSVRGLSAIAQGKTAYAGGGVVGSGKQVIVESGAIQLMSPVTDPYRAAEIVLDGLATSVR